MVESLMITLLPDLYYSSSDLDSSPDLSPFLLDLDFASKDSDLNLDLKAMDMDLDSEVLPASHFFKSFFVPTKPIAL